MSYGLKYYKNFTRDGHSVSLQLWKKGTSGTTGAKEIGDFVSLSLCINESNAGIDEAIHKSTATFSMVDSVDKADTATTKFGAWEELYTSDATEWQTVIKMDGTTIWTGYITPDSWEDDLVYHGTLTITARDNIGHMSDLPFSIDDIPAWGKNGEMASVLALIGAGLTSAGVAMDLDAPDEGSAHWLKSSGQLMYNWMIDTRAFEGKTWYEAVESVMAALGLTLRVGSTNRIVLAPLRNLPLCGGRTTPSSKTPVFINQSGHRSLSPAYKKIAESCSFEAVTGVIDTFPASAFSGGVLSKVNWTAPNIKQYTYNNPFGDESGGGSKYALMSVAYVDVSEPTPDMSSVEYAKRIIHVANRTKVNVSFELAHTFEDGSMYKGLQSGLFALVKLEWSTGTNGSLKYYWDFTNKEWSASDKYMEAQCEENAARETISIEATTPNEKGRLAVYVGLYTTYPFETSCAVRFGNFTIDVDSASFPSKVNVNTNYYDGYNLVLNRSTSFAQCPSWMLSAGSIVNGVYLNDAANYFPPVSNVIWDDRSTSLPLAVHVHMQLVALHAKPNNILSGDMLDGTSGAPGFNNLWSLYGRTFILNAGNYNLLDGIVYGAQLVEFDTWESVCGSMTADYQYNDDNYTSTSGSTSSGVTASGGGGTSGGITIQDVEAYLQSNHYINNLTSADITGALGFTPANASGLNIDNWNTAYNNNHTHDNKAVLDDIESVDISSWNEAASKSHEHSNKAVLDGITSQKVSGWNYASDTSHTHANKEALDSLTMNDVTNARTAYNNTHTHSNKSVIDGITSAKVTAWNNKYTLPTAGIPANDLEPYINECLEKAHTHTNKGVLDGIDADDISNWNAIADKALTKEAADKLYQPIGGGGSGIFVCAYGTSTYAAVESVYRTSTVICDKSGCALPLVKVDSDDNFYFKGFCGDKITTAKLTASSNWSYTETEPGESDFYIVNYAGVTMQDLGTAYSAGKKLICKKDNGYFFLTKKDTAGYHFCGTKGTNTVELVCGALRWTTKVVDVNPETVYIEYGDGDSWQYVETCLMDGKKVFCHDGNTNIAALTDYKIINGTAYYIFCGFDKDANIFIYKLGSDDSWDTEVKEGGVVVVSSGTDSFDFICECVAAGYTVTVRKDMGNNRSFFYHLVECDPNGEVVYFMGCDRDKNIKLCTVDVNNDWDVE